MSTNEQKLRDYLNKVAAELHQTRRRLRDAEARAAVTDPAADGGTGPGAEEPIAIVGMACRFPGGADTPDELWRLVTEERDVVGPFPTDRGWDLDHLYDPDPDRAGRSYAREGGFLYDAGEFDADFFGISPREALAAEPQQRLLLETAWQALEDAAIDPAALRGTRTGVFAGVIAQEYGPSMHHLPAEQTDGYVLTGTTTSVASGRVGRMHGFDCDDQARHLVTSRPVAMPDLTIVLTAASDVLARRARLRKGMPTIFYDRHFSEHFNTYLAHPLAPAVALLDADDGSLDDLTTRALAHVHRHQATQHRPSPAPRPHPLKEAS